MKIQIVSDIHLEWQKKFRIDNKSNADVLVVAGDLAEWSNAPHNNLCKEFLRDVGEKFEHVIYIFGNHEFYNNTLGSVPFEFNGWVSNYPNIHLLNDSNFIFDDVIFIGGTLWTDLKGGDFFTKFASYKNMNDYCYINGLTTDKWMKMNQKTRQYIIETIAFNDGKKFPIIVTHHAMSFVNKNPLYRDTMELDYSYHNTGLDDFIADNEMICINGHSHNTSVIKLGKSQIIQNSKGYGDENSKFNPNFTIEV